MNSLISKFFYVFGMITLTGYEAAFLSFPRNEMALANKTFRFLCSTDSDEPLRWYVIYVGTTEYITLFTRGKLTPFGELRYRIDTSIRGQYNLIIESVNISFAGKYKCSEGPSGSYVEAELAVIDSQPLCQANASGTDRSVVENDYLWIQCSISFTGNTTPSMIWIRKSTGSLIQNISNQRNQSMIVIQVNSTDNGETFTFKATFRQENNPRETVVTWNCTLMVLYTPRNLVVSPVKTVYVVGDRLECSSDGNPTPSYDWTDTGTNRTIYGCVLTIMEHMNPDQNHTFRCTAYNTLDGLRKHISETVTFSVTGSTLTPSDISGQTALLVAVVAVTTFCFITGIGYICFKVCNKMKSKRQEALAEEHQSELNRELEEETRIASEHSQHHGTTDQSLDNEGNYADLTDRSFNDQQYSRLNIYANESATESAKASVNTEYAKREFLDLLKLSPDYYNIAGN